MASQYAVLAAVGALGLSLGLVLGLVLGWLWHRATISKLRGLIQSERARRHRLRAQAEARLEELRARLRER